MSVESNAGEWIVKTSQKEKAQLVVVGPRGMGLIRRTILGSVSDYVIKHAKCAVAVVHADKTVKQARMNTTKWRESGTIITTEDKVDINRFESDIKALRASILFYWK